MSQIPRSQFALKKHRQNMEVPTAAPLPVLDLERNGKAAKKNGNANGHKNGSFDNDVLIIDEDIFANVEEVVATIDEPRQQFDDLSPGKKKRSRKSKDSTESRESDVSKKTTEKSPDKTSKLPVKKTTQVEQTTTSESGVEVASEPKELKIIKMVSDDGARSRRSDRLQNASTIVNLSTISTSEQSKMLNDETIDSVSFVPERRVSGRRSTRPIDDIKFEYRSPNVDESLNGTTDATIGSEFNDSLLNTPAGDRKRALNDSSENIDSPKRSRLDLSGLFSSFSSPVALLRNRFKRANIASTPIAGAALLDESVDAPEMKEVELTENTETVTEGNDDDLQVVTTPIKKRSCVVM